MNVWDAWTTLGRDPAAVMQSIAGAGGLEDRAQAAIRELEKARSLSRKLMAAHHPDRNAGDDEAAVRFRRVSNALDCLEKATADFVAKARGGDLGPRKPRDFIEVIKI